MNVQSKLMQKLGIAITSLAVEFLPLNKEDRIKTVDKMAHLGRSIDTDLINPLTYRCMTDSSSGTAINILKGINDFGIGT